MRTIQVPVPLLAAVAATRGMLGMGVGLLAGRSMPDRVRRPLGWSLLAIGALSTIPIAMSVFGRIGHRPTRSSESSDTAAATRAA